MMDDGLLSPFFSEADIALLCDPPVDGFYPIRGCRYYRIDMAGKMWDHDQEPLQGQIAHVRGLLQQAAAQEAAAPQAAGQERAAQNGGGARQMPALTELAAIRQWVCWRSVANGKDKPKKVPLNVHTGNFGSSTDAGTWGTLAEAKAARRRYKAEGVGFVFTKDAGIVGVDLDNCVNEAGEIAGWAQAIIQAVDGYTEYSPSGRGVHILAKGAIPAAVKTAQVEMYDTGRYFTVTGKRVEGTAAGLECRQEAITELYEQFRQSRLPATTMGGVNGAAAAYGQVALADAVRQVSTAPEGTRNNALFQQTAGLLELANGGELDRGTAVQAMLGAGMAAGLSEKEARLTIASAERSVGSNSRSAPQSVAAATILLLNTDLALPDVAVEGEGGLFDMPALPEIAQLPAELAVGACPWLDEYIAFSRRMSPRGYDDFHEAAGLWLLSTIAARRLVIQLGQKRFFPNLYIAFCALTTMFAKSTTAHIAHKILRELGLSYLLAPDEATPQAFLQLMASKLPDNLEEMPEEKQRLEKLRFVFRGQRGWYYDEFGMKLSALMRDNGVMADFRGLLRVLDDGRDSFEYSTIGRGQNLITDPYLALLASLTPADIKPYAGKNAPLWRDGFWARFAFITPPLYQQPGKGRFPEEIENLPERLTTPLKAWHARLGVPAVTITPQKDDAGKVKGYEVECEPLPVHYMQLQDGVLDAYYRYHDALVGIAGIEQESPNADLIGNYGRLAEKGMRIAMLLASVSGATQVEVKHWAKAQQVAERWRQNLHNLAAQVNAPEMSESAKRQEKVTTTAHKLMEQGEVVTVRNLYQRLRKSMSVDEISKVCKDLTSAGLMKVEQENRKTVYTLT